MAPFSAPGSNFLVAKITILFVLQQCYQDLIDKQSLDNRNMFLHHVKHCLYPCGLCTCALHVLNGVHKQNGMLDWEGNIVGTEGLVPVTQPNIPRKQGREGGKKMPKEQYLRLSWVPYMYTYTCMHHTHTRVHTCMYMYTHAHMHESHMAHTHSYFFSPS